jgi:hypothetical protein
MDQRRSREDQLAEELQGLQQAAAEAVAETEAESTDQEEAVLATPDDIDSAAEPNVEAGTPSILP